MVAPEAYLEEIHEYEVSEDEVSDKFAGVQKFRDWPVLACGLKCQMCRQKESFFRI